MHKSNLLWGTVALIVLAVLAACSTTAPLTPTRIPPTGTSAPTPTPVPKPTLELQPCKLGQMAARCGTLSVYEDRAASAGRKLDLRVMVVPARNAPSAPDPVFWLAGGPGESAIEWGSYAMQLLGTANAQRDVVMVDLRGTGGSHKLVCPRPTDPTLQVQALQSCLENLEGDPRAYTTAWAMDDVDDVRAALGYDQINFYGGSFGTEAAQIYLLRHGEHVRTAALDGATLLDIPIFERLPNASANALEKLFVRCEVDPACRSEYPRLRQEFAGALARVERAPVPLTLNDPSTGQPIVLTPENFKTVVHAALAVTPTTAALPRFIHLVYMEDWSRLAVFLEPFLSGEPSAPQWQIMNLTILCSEDWAKMSRAEIDSAGANTYLKYTDVRALTVPEAICAVMPSPPTAALYGALTGSAVPIVFFNGEVDPQDPPENVAGAGDRFPNSLRLVAPGQAHGFTGIPCRASILAEFYARGSVQGLSTKCLQEVELPPFL